MLRKLTLATVLLPSAALAHDGHFGGHPFVAGLSHPLGGTDHLLAMLAVGLWAAVAGGRALWAMPLAFVAALLSGGLAGAAGIAVPMVEPMILASITLFGLAAALRLRAALPLALSVVAVFGAAHGVAHGAEGPTQGLLPYAAGFVLASGGLHLAGLALGRSLLAARLLGAGTAVAGLLLAVGG